MGIQAGRQRSAALIGSAARFSTGRKSLGLLAIVVTIRFPRGLWGWNSNKYDLKFFPVQRRLVLPPDMETDQHGN